MHGRSTGEVCVRAAVAVGAGAGRRGNHTAVRVTVRARAMQAWLVLFLLIFSFFKKKSCRASLWSLDGASCWDPRSLGRFTRLPESWRLSLVVVARPGPGQPG